MTLRRGFFPALVTMCRVTVSTADMTADRLTLTGADIITQADTTSFWATVGRRQLFGIWLIYLLPSYNNCFTVRYKPLVYLLKRPSIRYCNQIAFPFL